MKTVYLAGPISGLSFDGATDWREEAIKYLKRFDIKGLSPLRGKEYLKKEKEIKDSYENTALSSSRGIYTRDRYDCMTCNVILVNLLGAKRVSIGTVMEMAWTDSIKTPIVAIMEKEGNPHDHAMVKEAIGFRVETLKEGLDIVTTILS